MKIPTGGYIPGNLGSLGGENSNSDIPDAAWEEAGEIIQRPERKDVGDLADLPGTGEQKPEKITILPAEESAP